MKKRNLLLLLAQDEEDLQYKLLPALKCLCMLSSQVMAFDKNSLQYSVFLSAAKNLGKI